jgi:hypothetical protein
MLSSFIESLILDDSDLRAKFVKMINDALDKGLVEMQENDDGEVDFFLVSECDCEE